MKRRSFLQSIVAASAASASFPFLIPAPASATPAPACLTLYPYPKGWQQGIMVCSNDIPIGESVTLAGVRYTVISLGMVTESLPSDKRFRCHSYHVITLDRPLEGHVGGFSPITKHGQVKFASKPIHFVSHPLETL